MSHGDRLNNKASNLVWMTPKEIAESRERRGKTSRGPSHSKAIRRGLFQYAVHQKGRSA